MSSSLFAILWKICPELDMNQMLYRLLQRQQYSILQITSILLSNTKEVSCKRMPSTARTDEKKSEEDKESVLFSTDTENGGRTGLKLT